MSDASGFSGKALLSAVLGVLALPLLAFAGVPALVLGLGALREVNQSDGRLRGRPFAIAGLVLGGLGTLNCIIVLIALALLHVRERGARSTCENNLRRIGQVVNLYHDTHGHFPAGTVPHAALAVEQRWSWHSSLLVFLDRDHPKEFNTPGLWKDAAEAMHLEEAWDADINGSAVNFRLRTFVCPSYLERPDEGTPGLTTYIGIGGIGADAPRLPPAAPRAGLFGYDRHAKRSDCAGGISNTMMAAESGNAGGPWAAGGPSTVRGVDFEATPYIGVGRPWGGLHPEVVNVLMVDGGVVSIRDTIDPAAFVELAKLQRK